MGCSWCTQAFPSAPPPKASTAGRGSAQSISSGWNSEEKEKQSLLPPNQRDFLLAVLKSPAARGPEVPSTHQQGARLHRPEFHQSCAVVGFQRQPPWSRELTRPAAPRPQRCTSSHHTAAQQQPAGIKDGGQGGGGALITLFAQLKGQNTHQNNTATTTERLRSIQGVSGLQRKEQKNRGEREPRSNAEDVRDLCVGTTPGVLRTHVCHSRPYRGHGVLLGTNTASPHDLVQITSSVTRFSLRKQHSSACTSVRGAGGRSREAALGWGAELQLNPGAVPMSPRAPRGRQPFSCWRTQPGDSTALRPADSAAPEARRRCTQQHGSVPRHAALLMRSDMHPSHISTPASGR